MNRNQSTVSWGGIGALAAIAAIALGGLSGGLSGGLPGTLVRADEQPLEGPIVAIGEDAVGFPALPVDDQQDAEAGTDPSPALWLGIAGGPIDSPILRTHLQLAADMGVVVEEVAPHSPAEKAGLRKHDVIIRVGNEAVHGMEVLQQAVAGGEGKPLELRVIRLGKEIDVTATPEPRPAVAGRTAAADPEGFPFGLPGMGQDPGFQLRFFGPGMFLQGNQGMPNGVSVQIQRQNDQPAEITVSQGEETWTLRSDDPAALEKLPEELRPYVKQLMAQTNNMGGMAQVFGGAQLQGQLPQLGAWEEELEALLPRMLGDGGFGGLGARADQARQRADEVREKMQERMERMEKHLEQLQRSLEQRKEAAPAEPAAPAAPAVPGPDRA